MLVTPTNEVMYPMEIQSRLGETIHTHNAVSVGASGNSQGTYFDTLGFTSLAVTFINSASTTSIVEIFWSNDNATNHGAEQVIVSGTNPNRVGEVTTKARYAKVVLYNNDATARTMSAWAFLKC